MFRRYALIALAVTLGAALLTSPARAADNDLEDPNSCYGVYGAGDSPPGTVVVLPPGVPPTPTSNPDETVVVNGVPQSNVYMCVAGHWIRIGTALEVGLRVLPDATSVSTTEGSPATVTGTYAGADEGTTVTLDASSGVVTAFADGTWSWTATPDDGPGGYPVTITGIAGDKQATAGFDVDVSNVAPTVTSLSPSPAIALVGQPVTFTGIATDPSGADMSAGFLWSFAGPITFDTCGNHTIDATATDKDAGISAPATSAIVQVVDASFGAPLTSGARNLVRAGQVVPVRLSVGCDGASAGGLRPAISLVAGDVDPATSSDDPALIVPAADATGETTGVMREVGGAYLYNLRVPDGRSGALFTVRVRPAAGAGPLSVVLQLR